MNNVQAALIAAATVYGRHNHFSDVYQTAERNLQWLEAKETQTARQQLGGKLQFEEEEPDHG